jgi:hypothetical protein
MQTFCLDTGGAQRFFPATVSEGCAVGSAWLWGSWRAAPDFVPTFPKILFTHTNNF